MATWGSYLSSYVKKTSDPRQVELEETPEEESSSKTSGALSRMDSITSQKSNSSAKKLYHIKTEPINQPFQQSNSNAARVAKMFGYEAPPPVTEEKVEDVVMQPVAPLATWRKIESQIMQPVAPGTVAAEVENKEIPVVPPLAIKKAEPKLLPSIPPTSRPKEDIFAMLDDFANMVDNPDAIQILTDLREKTPAIKEIKVQKVFAPDEAKENPVTVRKNSLRSQISPILSRPKLVVLQGLQSEPSDHFRARMLEFERQSEEMRLERQKRDEEREQILKYERMSEQFRLEKESMEIERARMLEEQMRFQAEADRIAEEERQMAQFMKDFQMEMDRDRENEARKFRAAQEAELQRQQAIEAAERANQEAELQRQKAIEAAEQAEKYAKRQREIAIEAEERKRREQADIERKLTEYDKRRAQRQRDDEDKKQMARPLNERLAQEEADRLSVKLREEQEAERRRKKYAAEQKADGEKFLQREADMKRQRARDERIATQRRVAKERAERSQYEEDESRRRAQANADRRFNAERRLDLDQKSEFEEDRPLTKEEEFKKAEEKIREAFVGLAKERGQQVPVMQRSNTVSDQKPGPIQPIKNYGRGITPAGRESRIYKGGPEGLTSESGVSRSNTVALRPQPPEKPSGLRRPPRNQAGSLGSVGLPGGPRTGLSAGPRRNRTVQ